MLAAGSTENDYCLHYQTWWASISVFPLQYEVMVLVGYWKQWLRSISIDLGSISHDNYQFCRLLNLVDEYNNQTTICKDLTDHQYKSKLLHLNT